MSPLQRENSPLEGPFLDRKEFLPFSRSSCYKLPPRSLPPDEGCTRAMMAPFQSPLWGVTSVLMPPIGMSPVYVQQVGYEDIDPCIWRPGVRHCATGTTETFDSPMSYALILETSTPRPSTRLFLVQKGLKLRLDIANCELLTMATWLLCSVRLGRDHPFRSSCYKLPPRSLPPDEGCTRAMMAPFQSPLWGVTSVLMPPIGMSPVYVQQVGYEDIDPCIWRPGVRHCATGTTETFDSPMSYALILETSTPRPSTRLFLVQKGLKLRLDIANCELLTMATWLLCSVRLGRDHPLAIEMARISVSEFRIKCFTVRWKTSLL
ncbi:hypothetical protein TNCV_4909291 [Trichonephila clavipes]|uniref:Uncharacterized protein n=1 Tax=Trichonephila clavipes TaxID=2585209 RepID=A0A8X6RVJ8_TRICX|nr:hypothetical protein TNCV_4909291 [Trichonephila clavipes]